MHVDRTSAGELLRWARTSAGLTQVELANRLGMQQSVISAYESGHRQPVLPTLAAMIDATGYHLHVDVRPGRLSRKLGGPLGKRVLRHRHRLIKAAARYGAANLGIFGSVARGVERPDSDIDVLVDLSPESGLLTLMRLEHDFEGILGTSVDVVPSDSVKARASAGHRAGSRPAVTPSDGARLDDIDAALRAIREHLTRGPLDEGLVFDAVRVRLIEIGESVKRLSPDLLKHEPEIPWTQIAAMRNRLAHRYFDTSHAVLQATVDHDLPELEQVVRRLAQHAAQT